MISECTESINEKPTSVLAPLNTFTAPSGYTIQLVQCAVPNCGHCETSFNSCTSCFDGYILRGNNCISISDPRADLPIMINKSVNAMNTTIIDHVLLNDSEDLNTVTNTTVPCAPLNKTDIPQMITPVEFETNMTLSTCKSVEPAFKLAVQKSLKQNYIYVELNQIKITCNAAYVQDLAEFGVDVATVTVEMSRLQANERALAMSTLEDAILVTDGECTFLDYLQDIAPDIFLGPKSSVIASKNCHQTSGHFCLPLGISNAWCCSGDMSCIEGKCTEATVITPQPTSSPTTAPPRKYKKRKRSHCGSILTGTFDSYSSAVAGCNGNGQCFGVYDNQCDNQEPFYMCGGPHTWDISPASCVYQKVVPITSVKAGEVCGGISCEEVILSFGVPCSTSWLDGCGHVSPPPGFSEKSVMYSLCPVMCPGKRIKFTLELTGVMFDAVDSTISNLKVVLQAMFLRSNVSASLAQIHINTTIVKNTNGKINMKVDILHLTPTQELKVTSLLKKAFKKDGGGMTRLLKEAAVDKFKDLQVKFVQHLSSNKMPTPNQKGNLENGNIKLQVYHRPRTILPKSIELIEIKNRWKSLGRHHRIRTQMKYD